MKLLEYKGKELLKKSGIKIPPSIITNNKSYINLSYHKEKYKEFFFDHKNVIIKAQIISGSRKKNNFIVGSSNYKESLNLIDKLYKTEYNNQLINTLLIEKKLDMKEEYFLSIIYDTLSRSPLIIFSRKGGIDVNKVLKKKRYASKSIRGTLNDYEARNLAKAAGFEKSEMLKIAALIKKAYNCFEKYDCKSLEINPIIKTPEGILYAGDAKITIDDNAIIRQDILRDETDIEDKTLLNERELEARKIDYHDHRGVAGKTYFDLEGDIAILASGGGASLTCMDAVIEAGGKPANYTEYSGNPSREKVKQLTKITLSKPNLKGCLVIGGTANFTDIFETLSGFIEGLKSINPKPTYPIIIRRAGPNDKKAFDMIRAFAKKEGFDITLFGEETPMAKASRIMVEKVKWE
ncbi:MAG: hypothetical protein ISS25_00380 [Nanoarchaeota archaeon]|nr:hypothetical protein [DPANN group archaeon]MBL7116273.1 hypothetical protein [Nanoarchaeota archaeon]